MRCLRCGNEDEKYFFKLKNKYICRKCITFIGKEATFHEVLENDFQIKLKYPLSEKQQEISNQVLQAFIDNKNVLIHAICDALLGAANMRDIGYHFPDTAGEYAGIDSKILLRKTMELLRNAGYELGNIDATVAAERPKLNPHIPEMKRVLAKVLDCDEEDISIKATTTERLGFTGRQEGIAAYATVLIMKSV